MSKIILNFIVIAFIFIFSFKVEAKELLRDEFIEQQLQTQNVAVPQTNLKYNYESLESVEIKLKLVSGTVSTKKNKVYDGMPLKFEVKNQPKYKGKVLVKQGTLVNARVSIYRKRGMNGIPASILVEDFDIPGLPDSKILGSYQKVGQDRTLWLLPMKWALTVLWPSGYFVNFVKGGHAVLSDKDTITLKYFPQWGELTSLQIEKNNTIE